MQTNSQFIIAAITILSLCFSHCSKEPNPQTTSTSMDYNISPLQIQPKESEVIKLCQTVTDQADKQNYIVQLKLYADGAIIEGESNYTVGMPIDGAGEACFPLNAHFSHPKTTIPQGPIPTGVAGMLQSHYNENYLVEYTHESQTAWRDPDSDCGLIESGYAAGDPIVIANASTKTAAEFQNYVGASNNLFLASYPEGYEIPYTAPLYFSLYSPSGGTLVETSMYLSNGATSLANNPIGGEPGVHTFSIRAETLFPENPIGVHITHATIESPVNQSKTVSFLHPDNALGCCATHLACIGKLGNFDYVWGVAEAELKSQITKQITSYTSTGRQVLAIDGYQTHTTFIRSNDLSKDYIHEFMQSKEHYWYNEEEQAWKRIIPTKKSLNLYKSGGYVWSEFSFYEAE